MKTFDLKLSSIEYFMSLQGNFCLVDWLLKENYLVYSQYEDWRYGKESFLDDGLDVGVKEVDVLIHDAQRLCEQLGLSTQEQDYYPWREGEKELLRISKRKPVHVAFSQQWMRPQDLPQMDLFMDNSGVIAENDILAQLSARQFDQSQQHLERLTELNPNHEKLGKYQDLINYGHHMSSSTVSDSDLVVELAALENEVLPLAREMMKHNARDYLAFAWRRLSECMVGKAFDAQKPELHISYALMQIPDWNAVLDCLKKDHSLQSSPELLRRLAVCYESLKLENESIVMWCLLMELDGEYCEKSIERKDSPVMWSLWQDFWDINDGGLKSFFPAFVFASRPGLVHLLDKLPPLQVASNLAVIEAIQARLSGSDEISARKKMQDISPGLLRLYLNAK